jgi:hypothetical protein
MSKRKRRHPNKSNRGFPNSRFRIHPKAFDIANRLGGDALIESLKEAFQRAAHTSNELRECTQFSLLDDISLELLALTDEQRQIDWFWQQVNELLVLVSRTASRGVLNTIDGISWAMGSGNELVLALAARSFLEHAAALRDIGGRIAPIQDRLITEIWPNHRRESAACRISEVDKNVRMELIRFAVGRRVQFPSESSPCSDDSKSRWEKFTKSLRRVPEEFQAKQILNSIDSLNDEPGNHHLRSGYEFLCEYCHPNSASRTLDFRVNRSEFGKHHLTLDFQDGFTKGFRNVFALCRAIIPACCEAIEKSFTILSSCRKPMPPGRFGLAEPPMYGKRGVDEFGRVGWFEAGQIVWNLPESKATLTESQLERIARIDEAICGLDFDITTGQPMTFERRAEMFSCEEPFIEEEIHIWEHWVDVFQRELVERRDNSRYLRSLLFLAIRGCFEAPSVGDALSV